MNARRAAFAQAYVYGPESAGNAAASARAAGYSKHTADRLGNQLLSFLEVQAEVARLTAERDAAIKAEGIAARQYRIDSANERHQLLWRVITERAADSSVRDAPGAGTGLLVRTYKQLGIGRAAETVEEYAVDTGLLKELRELEKQAAQDIGQWTEKRELTGKDGGPVGLQIIDQVIADGDGDTDA